MHAHYRTPCLEGMQVCKMATDSRFPMRTTKISILQPPQSKIQDFKVSAEIKLSGWCTYNLYLPVQQDLYRKAQG